jgi:uncharacterized glyoxalase superfamily protein PhnB
MSTLTDTRLVLAVRNLRASTQFYMDVLGFRRDFGDESDGWSFLSRDHVKVMLGECADERPASDMGNHSYVAYITVKEVDSLYDEFVTRGADVRSALTSEPWGMREFSVRTPDGHRIRFGEAVA